MQCFTKPNDECPALNESSLMTGIYKRIVKEFPKIDHAFSYGSGVFHQPGLYAAKGASKPMIDFIFGVQDPIQWHEEVGLLHVDAIHSMFFQMSIVLRVIGGADVRNPNPHLLLVQNMRRHSSHYSCLSLFGPDTVCNNRLQSLLCPSLLQ